MFTFPILFPLVKPFRASRSGKPFYVHPLTADTGENKASVRTENFTEYPIWYKFKAAGKFSVRKASAALDVSARPQYLCTTKRIEKDREAPRIYQAFHSTWTPRER